MGLQLESGAGNGAFKAKITEENKIIVEAVNEDKIAFESEVNKRSYVWSTSLNLGADKNVLWLRNDSSILNLNVDKIEISLSAASVIEIWVGTGNTVGGTTVTGNNLNRKNSSTLAIATCKHTNTNVDTGTGMTLLSTYSLDATNLDIINLRGALILGYLDEIALNVITDIDLISINLFGYFHKPL